MEGVSATPPTRSGHRPEQEVSSAPYRNDVDGLRAVAIACVVAHHLNGRLLPSGHLGVDMFFVISGYVITAALDRRRDSTLGTFLLEFYARRIRRLGPALAACVLLTGLAICLVDPAPSRSLATGISALFGLSNLYLLAQSADYFAAPAQLNVFTQTWSLGVEEQFYLVFPLLAWYTLSRGGESWARRAFAIVTACLALASLGAFLATARVDANAAFYLMPTRFWELGAGALCYAMVGAGLPASPRYRGLATAALVVATAAMCAPIAWGSATTVLVVAMTAGVIGLSARGSLAHAILSTPTFVGLGRASYSVYLWHWSVLSLGLWTIGDGPIATVVQLIAIAVLAAASYVLVETPLRSARWGSGPATTIVLGVAMLSAVAVALAWPMDGQLYSGRRLAMASSGTGSLTKEYRVDGQSRIWLGPRCIVAGDQDIGKHVAWSDCMLGNPDAARRRVLVLGDSFSASFVPGFDRLVQSDSHAVGIVASWGAAPAPGLEAAGAWARASRYFWSELAPDLISRLEPGDTVFLISDLAGYAPARSGAQQAAELAKLRDALDAFAPALSRRKIRLAVMHANPPAREARCEPVNALPQWYRPGVPCTFMSRAEAIARRAPLDAMLAELSARHGIIVVDLLDVFCPSETCSYQAADGSTLLYRDAHSHPSVEAVRLSAGRIRDALVAPVPAPR